MQRQRAEVGDGEKDSVASEPQRAAVTVQAVQRQASGANGVKHVCLTPAARRDGRVNVAGGHQRITRTPAARRSTHA